MNRRVALGIIGAFLSGCSLSRKEETRLENVSGVMPSFPEREVGVFDTRTTSQKLPAAPNVILSASANGSVSNLEECDGLYREDSSYLRLSYKHDQWGTSDIYVVFPGYELAKYRSTRIKRADIVLTLTRDFSTIDGKNIAWLQSEGTIFSSIHAVRSEWNERNLRYIWIPGCYSLDDYSLMGGTQPYSHREHRFLERMVWDITNLQYRSRVNEGKKIVSHWMEDPLENHGLHITLEPRNENSGQFRTFYSRTNIHPPRLRLWFSYGSDS